MSEHSELVRLVHQLLREAEDSLADGPGKELFERYVEKNTFSEDRIDFNEDLIILAKEIVDGINKG